MPQPNDNTIHLLRHGCGEDYLRALRYRVVEQGWHNPLTVAQSLREALGEDEDHGQTATT